MVKYFCDICEKELTSDTTSWSLTLEKKCPFGGYIEKEICGECKEKIADMFKAGD